MGLKSCGDVAKEAELLVLPPNAARRTIMEKAEELQMRSYDVAKPMVIILHGDQAAVGSAAPMARGWAAAFQALEPWHRGGGAEPLTVARHIADFHELVASRCVDCGKSPSRTTTCTGTRRAGRPWL